MTYSHISRRTPEGALSIGLRAQLSVALATLLALLALAVVAAPRAAAISDGEELTQFGGAGSGAGQLDFPTGIATDPVTGHVYVAERESNNRISEFTPWGKFVKAFGWDVAPGAVNEQQEVRIRASGGQFQLTFGASTTSDLAFDAPGSESEGAGSVEAALNALPSIAGVGANVSVEAVPGTADGKTPYIYVVAFNGSLGAKDVTQQLSVANGTTALGGGSPATEFEARTRADGTPGGTGLESCTAESGCKAGLKGPGAGQFSGAEGLAVDAAGDLLVREIAAKGGNARVQKFDSSGRFLLMFGGEVNKTKSAEVGTSEAERNRCTKAQLEGGDQCGVGTTGTGQGQFGTGFSGGIALGAAGEVFVADAERIQRFNLAGEFQASIPLAGNRVSYLAVDPVSGDLYATIESGTGVHKLDPTTGVEVEKIEGGQGVLATDPTANLYATGQLDGAPTAVLQFDSAGKPLSPPSCCTPPQNFSIEGLGTNLVGDLYVANISPPLNEYLIRLFGPAPVSFESAPLVPPTITAQFASSVLRDSATLAAEINPHFFTNTRYYVEYGTGKCSEGGCEQQLPVPPGALLTSKVSNSPLRSAGIFLEDLQPGTTYHYRFVAQSGGGSSFGIDPDGEDPEEASLEAGEEATFTTFPAPLPVKGCSNDAFRIGPGARLPDCRAYEMVSPIDKNNGDIATLVNFPGYNTNISQSAEGGERFAYSSFRSFGDPKGAPYTNQYLAARDPESGWSSEALNQPIEVGGVSQQSFENQYKVFSADLCSGWSVLKANPVLAPGASPGFYNLYRRDACGPESYEALIQVEPHPGIYPILLGSSADGTKAVLGAKDSLTPEASAGLWETYYAGEGQLHLVCIAPSGLPSAGNCSAGTGPEAPEAGFLVSRERLSTVDNAISADGSKVYWTDSGSIISGPGKVYLRLNPAAEQSAVSGGECTEAEKACTLKVSETKTSKPARFLGASRDGTKALFLVTEGPLAGKLYEFELGGGSREVAGEVGNVFGAKNGLGFERVGGVVGTSDDLSRIYFVSEEAISGTVGATAGKPNLYLDEEGVKTFIATISGNDAAGVHAPSDARPEPIYHAARVSPDGRVLTFISTESLTGYDSTDLASGEPASETYLYEVGAPGPVCVSCNPSGARPTARFVGGNGGVNDGVVAAGFLAMPESSLYTPRILSSDGRRLLFNSFDALLPRDTNGKEDVYEWERASSVEECEEKGADLYVEAAEGCLSLISSGESPQDSVLLDASANGNDAFFTTNASLLPQDPGLVDVYDARVDGGLPTPPGLPAACEGEACQGPLVPPNDPTPTSAAFKGPGNVKEEPKARCAKNKAKRKGRCVAKKHKSAKHKSAKHKAKQKRANPNRRTAR